MPPVEKPEFRRGCRKPKPLLINGKEVHLQEFYLKVQNPGVCYPTFRQRMTNFPKKRPQYLTEEIMYQAAKQDEKDWKAHWGSARINPFECLCCFCVDSDKGRGEKLCDFLLLNSCLCADIDEGRGAARINLLEYEGQIFPTAKSFASYHAKKLSRPYDEKLIEGRIKHARGKPGFNPIHALAPRYDEEKGIIYLIKQISTGKKYIGLTGSPLEKRWEQHVSSAKNGTKKNHLAQAIRKGGEDDFTHKVLAEYSSLESGREKEKEYIKELNTQHPDGLNMTAGGESGSGRGIEVEFEGKKYRSKKHRNEEAGKEYNHSDQVAGTWIETGKDLNETSRKVSQDRLPDPRHQRQWLGIKRQAERGEIVLHPPWYHRENWIRDINPEENYGKEENHAKKKLEHLDISKPFAPGNVAWLTPKEAKEEKARIRGTAIYADGQFFSSLAELAEHSGIGRTTLHHRIYKQHMTPDEAIADKNFKTAAKRTIFEGEEFPSTHEATRVLSKRHNTSFEKARDRIRRGIPTSRWAEMNKKA